MKLTSKILIGSLEYTSLVSASVQSSWELFTDTCRLEFATDLRDKNKNIYDNIKIGDTVSVTLGYYPNVAVVFTGFVTKVEQNNPVSVYCEDWMWKLKQITIKEFVSNSVTVQQLLDSFYLPIPFEAPADSNLGKLRVKDATVVEILDTLKDTYGLISYIRDDVLIVGTVRNDFRKNFELYFNGETGTIIDDSLQYQKTDVLDIYVKGVSIAQDNSKIELYGFYKKGEIEITDKEKTTGEQRVFNYYGITKKELEQKLRDILPTIFYEGYRGTFTTFLRPKISFSDHVTLRDLKFPERDGTYLVKQVETTFGADGGRQIITLDLKVN